MDKKKLGIILMGAAVVVLIFTLILYCVSASFVGDAEDMINFYAQMGVDISAQMGVDISGVDIGYGQMDVDISADTLRGLLRLCDEMGADAGMEIGGSSFDIFALFGRGWFLAAGLLLALAGVVIVAVDKDSKLGSDLLGLAKRFGKAVAAGFKGIFAGMPRPASRPKYTCPQCGAPYSAGTMFCGKCGSKLPDPATIGVCKHCGTRNEPGSRFCAGCGQPLN